MYLEYLPNLFPLSAIFFVLLTCLAGFKKPEAVRAKVQVIWDFMGLAFYFGIFYLLISFFVFFYGWNNDPFWGEFAYLYSFAIIILTILALLYCVVKTLLSIILKNIRLGKEFHEERWKKLTKQTS